MVQTLESKTEVDETLQGSEGPAPTREEIAADLEARVATLRRDLALDPAEGPDRLAHFNRSPAATQAEFWLALAKHVAKERRLDLAVEAMHGPLRSNGMMAGAPRWTKRWRDRAYNRRMHEERGARDNGFSSFDAERLKGIDAETYVEALTGEEVPPSRKICCPLPDHDERTPSFHVRGTTWRCFGCGAHGTIYDLAAAVSGRELRGRDFLEIHGELLERFG